MTDTTRPVGAPVDPAPARLPGPVTLSGRFGSVARLDALRDAGPLWQALRGHDEVWTYMSTYGPFADEAAFSAWLAERQTLKDPYYYAALDAEGRALGLATLMEIRPAMRVIEVGQYRLQPGAAADAAWHRNSVSAGALCVRDAWLPALRMEMRFAERAVAARRRALRVCFRGHPAPAHDRQGP